MANDSYPKPWTIDELHGEILDANGTAVLYIPSRDLGYFTISNTVVAAVNAHAALVEALESAKKTIRVWHSMGIIGQAEEAATWKSYQSIPEMKFINRALAIAKGEK